MNEKEILSLLYAHQFTDEEKAESTRIIQILEQEGFIDQISYGFSQDNDHITDKSYISPKPNLFIYIVVIKNENGFQYYYIETEEDCFFIMDFQEKWLLKIQENEPTATPLNCFLYFVIHYKLDNRKRKNYKEVDYILKDGKCMRKISINENYKYESILEEEKNEE